MPTQEPAALSRRRLLGSSAILAAWVAGGCDRTSEESGTSESTTPTVSSVPLRLTLVGQPQDSETITRAWAAVTEQPLAITTIALDRSNSEEIASAVMADAEKTDVVVLPLGILAEAIRKELVVPLSGPEFDESEGSMGEIVSAARNGAARYAGESYSIPLGAAQPFLLASEETEPVDSWQAYDQLVERWEGRAAEPTAAGWAAAMFLWRSASERNWLFSRESLEPLVQSEPYVRSLEQMVQTCSRYQVKSQTPQQVWEGVASLTLRGGIGFPELRTEQNEIVTINELPGTTDSTRVLLDPFSPVIALASSCRQTAIAKRFMLWISGGEGSQSMRRQIRGMTDTRIVVASTSASTAMSSSEYDGRLLQRLSSPVTMPTLQLLDAAGYYSELDRQVIRAINEEISPADAMAEVADRWQAITERVGTDHQLRMWRRAQGMRS